MSATVAGAVKAWLEAAGLGVAVYRDGPPLDDHGEPAAPLPYAVVQEGVGVESLRHGDNRADESYRELVQVDLYQTARAYSGSGPGTKVTESYTLPGAITARLNGAALPAIDGVRPAGCYVDQFRRWPVSNNEVRHTWDLFVYRRL